jgi:hypothetical protein
MWNSAPLRQIAVLGCTLSIAFFLISSDASPKSKDYSHLIDFLKVQYKKEAPLYAFNTFENESSKEDHRIDVRFFNEHPTLIQDIRKDLGYGEIAWRLERARQRLLFVPEPRKRFATLFEDYCRDVIDFALEKTHLENPYVKIETLQREQPGLSEKGVTAFLVHNLAKEVVGTYVFSNPFQKSLMIEISRKTFLGEVGSYTTNIRVQQSGAPEFLWDNFTIWQTTAKNPIAVLCVPVEETLHIALREHTHRAIRRQISPTALQDPEPLEAVVDDWMAVEEALVGSVTFALVPEFFRKYAIRLPDSLLEEEIESRDVFKKYLHLERAIRVVDQVGHERAIKMYINQPEDFRKALL